MRDFRQTAVTLRRAELPAGVAIHATIDGAAAGYFQNAEAAVFNVSESARHPHSWPAASVSSRVLIETDDAREVTRRIEAFAVRGPKSLGGR